jgi:PAS domain-containing protein
MIRPTKIIKDLFRNWLGYLIAIGSVALATWLKYLAQPNIIPADVPILYIVAIVITATFFGLGPSIFCSVLSVLAFSFFFIPPANRFALRIQDVPILVIFLMVGVLISYLSFRVRAKTEVALQEIEARKKTEAELAEYRDHLEELVKQRTAELRKANDDLKREVTEHKQAEESLEEKQFRLHVALESGKIGIHEWNIVTNELTWDERVYDFWGLERGTPVTLDTFVKAIHPDDIAATQAAMEKALDPDNTSNYYTEFRMTGIGNETQRWLAATGYVIFKGKRPVKLIGATWDITERKKVEESIKNHERLLQSLFDSPGIMRGIVEIVDDTTVRHIADNAVSASFLGLPSEALRNKLSTELGEPPEIIRVWVNHYRQSLEIGKPVTFEYEDKRADQKAWLSATVSYLRTTESGQPQLLTLFSTLWSARRRKRRSERHETTLITYLTMPMLL